MFQMSSLSSRGAGCGDLLSCVFGLKEFEQRLFYMVAVSGSSTLDSLASRTGRDRSTVHRALTKLVAAGLCYRRTVGLRDGGYMHEYSAMDTASVGSGIRRRVDELKDSLERLAAGFETELNERIRLAAQHGGETGSTERGG